MNPITGESTWSLGIIIGVPVAALLLLAALVFIVVAILSRDGALVLGGVAALVVLGVVTGLTLWPFDAEYHKWWTVHGKVASVDKRLISDGDKGMSERFVLTVAGEAFGVDDTRAATVRPGDTVTLSCKREWQYAADSGWACHWQGVSR